MSYKTYKHYTRRSSCVVPVSDMLEDLIGKFETPGDLFETLKIEYSATISGDCFEKGIVELWNKYFAKDFFVHNYSVDDVLTKYHDETRMILVNSRETFNQMSEKELVSEVTV